MSWETWEKERVNFLNKETKSYRARGNIAVFGALIGCSLGMDYPYVTFLVLGLVIWATYILYRFAEISYQGQAVKKGKVFAILSGLISFINIPLGLIALTLLSYRQAQSYKKQHNLGDFKAAVKEETYGTMLFLAVALIILFGVVAFKMLPHTMLRLSN